MQKVVQSVLAPFKKLPLGYYRIIISGWIVLPLLYSIIEADSLDRFWNDDDFFHYIIVVTLYYLFARLGVWIWEGFRQSNDVGDTQ